jgi:pyruvate decarboxylase
MDYSVYVGMSAPIRKTHTVLDNEATMTQEIDRVIREGVQSRLPVYIFIPMDVPGIQVDAKPLDTPLDLTIKNDRTVEDEVVQLVLNAIKKSTNPAILADVLTTRHGGKELVKSLVDITQFPTYSTPLSKGVVDETHPCYNGVYNGQGK